MVPALLAQFARPLNWGFGEIVIFVVIAAAIIGILYVVTRQMGVTIPGWAVQVFWIVVAACVGIVAIRFLLSL